MPRRSAPTNEEQQDVTEGTPGPGRRSRSGSNAGGRASRVPLYLQVKRALEQRIASGELHQGDLLPSESELCKMFGVSTITMRRALQDLTTDGLIRRQVGIGTFVAAETRRSRIAVIYLGFDSVAWQRRADTYGSLLSGIGDAAWHAHAEFSFTRIRHDEDPTPILRGMAAESRCDGVLLRTASDVNESHVAVLESRGIPYVVMKRHMPGRAMNFVTVDDADAVFRGVSHLIQHGHRRIGIIMGGQDILPRREQFRGFRKALQENGLAFEPDLVYATEGMPGSDVEGYLAIDELLSQQPPPTALFVCSDLLAAGATAALIERGLTIPNDIAIVAYGHAPALRIIQPPLTSLEVPYDRIGRIATETLLELIANPHQAARQIFLDVPLIIRGSCCEDGSGARPLRRGSRSRFAGPPPEAGERTPIVPGIGVDPAEGAPDRASRGS